MGNFTTGINSFLNMDSKRELHFPYEPSGVYAKMACCNLGFQMRWCAEELERRLEQQGTPHVIQFKCEGKDEEPESWELFADGGRVASGTGDFARSCFEQGSDEFLNVLERAVSQTRLPEISQREYWLLCRARRIARIA